VGRHFSVPLADRRHTAQLRIHVAGYTVALLAFPVVSTPQSTFDIVVARVQEITLGIICASVVATLVLPRSVASAISAQAERLADRARQLGMDVLTGRGGNQERDMSAYALPPWRPKSISLAGI